MSRFDIVERTMLICADSVASVETDTGERFEVAGIFDNAERNVELKRDGNGATGGLKYTSRQPVFTSADQRFTGINKAWRLTLRGKDYYCPEPHSDGAGWVTLWLADWVSVSNGDGGDHGVWR
jgi:hypothetical protein